MIGQRHCPFCKAPAGQECAHLATAVECRDFVRRCIDLSGSWTHWHTLCQVRRARLLTIGDWAPEREDYTWLETAFCDEFLSKLSWFGGMDYEWRTGPRVGQGGFWAVVWSKDPQRLWWQLHEEIEKQSARTAVLRSPPAPAPAYAAAARLPKKSPHGFRLDSH